MPLSDTLTLRNVKGTPLTNGEVDRNFTIIRDFINALEERVAGSVNEDGSLAEPQVVYGTSATGTDAYETALTNYTPAAESDLVGKFILLKPTDEGNEGVATLKISPLTTARSIVRQGGVALNTGDLRANHWSILVWDDANTRFELANPCTNDRENYYEDTGSVNAVVVTTDPDLPFAEPGALYAGYHTRVKILNTNTSATTLKIGGLAAAAVTKFGTTPLAGGELVAGQIAEFVYDGTQFQLLGLGNRVTTSADYAFTSANAVVLAATNHNLGGVPSNVTIYLVNKANNGAAGYAVGDMLPLECVVPVDSGTGAVQGTKPLSAWVNATQYGINSGVGSNWQVNVPKKGGTGGAAQTSTNFPQDWNVRVVMSR